MDGLAHESLLILLQHLAQLRDQLRRGTPHPSPFLISPATCGRGGMCERNGSAHLMCNLLDFGLNQTQRRRHLFPEPRHLLCVSLPAPCVSVHHSPAFPTLVFIFSVLV